MKPQKPVGTCHAQGREPFSPACCLALCLFSCLYKMVVKRAVLLSILSHFSNLSNPKMMVCGNTYTCSQTGRTVVSLLIRPYLLRATFQDTNQAPRQEQEENQWWPPLSWCGSDPRGRKYKRLMENLPRQELCLLLGDQGQDVQHIFLGAQSPRDLCNTVIWGWIISLKTNLSQDLRHTSAF